MLPVVDDPRASGINLQETNSVNRTMSHVTLLYYTLEYCSLTLAYFNVPSPHHASDFCR